MQKHRLIFLILVSTLILSCQKPVKKFKSSQFDPTSKSFDFLNEALKDVKILAIGESSHGFGSMHSLKGDLVKHLHEKLDFDVLLMEAGYADVGISWRHLEDSSPETLLNTTLSMNLRSKQMLPLFKYLIEQKNTEDPLEFGGIDTKVSGQSFRFWMFRVIGRLEPKVIQDSIRVGLKEFNKTFEVEDNPAEWQRYKDSYLDAIELSKSILTESREDIKELEIGTDEEIDILLRYFEMLVASVDYEIGEAYTKGLSIRDSLMADNVDYFVNKFPNKKIIVWGHNGHIEKGAGEGDNQKWLGHYLKEKYGDDYYAMGMFAKKGFIYQTSERKTSNFDLSNPAFIEHKIDADYGKNVFLDLPLYDETNTNWINKPINGYELEAGGIVKFIPSKRFDGIILLGETEAPDYLLEKAYRK